MYSLLYVFPAITYNFGLLYFFSGKSKWMEVFQDLFLEIAIFIISKAKLAGNDAYYIKMWVTLFYDPLFFDNMDIKEKLEINITSIRKHSTACFEPNL